MKNGVFLGIGIQSYEGGLSDLLGARHSAICLGAWAAAQGYTTKVLTDEEGALEMNAITDTMHELLGDGGQSRIIVAFAGHGMRRDGTEEYWLLSNWKAADGAINMARFRERLRTYRPKQIGFFSDACRTLPPKQARHVSGSGVIRFQDYDPASIEIVTLHGSIESEPALSTPTSAPRPYCFFSRVLFDTLKGDYSDNSTVVIEPDLRRSLKRELPLLAATYGRKQNPDPEGGFIENNLWSDLTLDMSELPSMNLPGSEDGHQTDADEENPIGLSKPVMVTAQSVGAGDRWNAKVENRRKLASSKRDKKYNDLLDLVPSTSSDAVVYGGTIEEQLVLKGLKQPIAKSSSVLLRLNHGYWVGAAKWGGSKPIFGCDGHGSVYLSLSNRGTPNKGLIDNLITASLGGRIEDLADLAARVRDMKHKDPVYGVIAGYAYLGMGSHLDARRMATFYLEQLQPIPFDVALACRLPLTWHKNHYRISIPAVQKREPLNKAEAERTFTYEERASCDGAVSGHFPWMRQGWNWLEDSQNDRLKELRSVVKDGLRASIFTTLSANAGTQLAAHLREMTS